MREPGSAGRKNPGGSGASPGVVHAIACRTESRMERYLLPGASARLVMTTGAEAPQMVEATSSPAMQVMLL